VSLARSSFLSFCDRSTSANASASASTSASTSTSSSASASASTGASATVFFVIITFFLWRCAGSQCNRPWCLEKVKLFRQLGVDPLSPLFVMMVQIC
jgi:hypothetical protein